MSTERALLFDIKEFAVHDGPGVRTTVFFKGCPLHCAWCHNPEGISATVQLMTKASRCSGCGRCRLPCTHPECQPFGRCRYACPDALISVCGREWSADELTERLLRGAELFSDSGGGVTFSGGEPLFQPAFLLAVLERMRRAGIHTTVETSGYAPPEIFREAARASSLVIMDLKISDPSEHQKYTGADNAVILRNAAYLRESGLPHLFRTPLIPGITDTEKNLRAIREIAGASPWETLPYNALAGAKYRMLGIPFPYDDIKE